MCVVTGEETGQAVLQVVAFRLLFSLCPSLSPRHSLPSPLSTYSPTFTPYTFHLSLAALHAILLCLLLFILVLPFPISLCTSKEKKEKRTPCGWVDFFISRQTPRSFLPPCNISYSVLPCLLPISLPEKAAAALLPFSKGP